MTAGASDNTTSITFRRGVSTAAQLAKVSVYVDGERVGRLAQNSQLEIPVAAGEHLVAVRLESSRSPQYRLHVPRGAEIRAECVVAEDAATALLRPREFVTIKLEGEGELVEAAESGSSNREREAQYALVAGVLSLLGFAPIAFFAALFFYQKVANDPGTPERQLKKARIGLLLGILGVVAFISVVVYALTR